MGATIRNPFGDLGKRVTNNVANLGKGIADGVTDIGELGADIAKAGGRQAKETAGSVGQVLGRNFNATEDSPYSLMAPDWMPGSDGKRAAKAEKKVSKMEEARGKSLGGGGTAPQPYQTNSQEQASMQSGKVRAAPVKSGATTPPPPAPLNDFASTGDQAAYERYVSGKGNAGTGFKVVDNGSTVTVTGNGKSTVYNQKQIDLDIQKAAEKSKQLLETPKSSGGLGAAGATATAVMPPAPTVTHPTEENLIKYNGLSAADKKQADAFFASKNLTAGTPDIKPNASGQYNKALAGTDLGNGNVIDYDGYTSPKAALSADYITSLKKEAAATAAKSVAGSGSGAGSTGTTATPTATLPTPPTVPKDAPYVDVVNQTGKITNLTQSEAAKYTSGNSGYVAVPQGSSYVPPTVTHPTQTQVNAYNALSSADKAKADAYFAAMNLTSDVPKSVGGGISGTSSNSSSLPTAAYDTSQNSAAARVAKLKGFGGF